VVCFSFRLSGLCTDLAGWFRNSTLHDRAGMHYIPPPGKVTSVDAEALHRREHRNAHIIIDFHGGRLL